MAGLPPDNNGPNIPHPPIKLEDAPLREGDIIMMRLPYDLTSHDTTADATWTRTSGSGAPRHPVVWISGADKPEDNTAIVNVLVMRSFQNSEDSYLDVQNSPLRHFFLPFPSPSASDATPPTPTEFGPPLHSPFFKPIEQKRINARITSFLVRSDISIKRFQPRALLPGQELQRVLHYARKMSPSFQPGSQMAAREGGRAQGVGARVQGVGGRGAPIPTTEGGARALGLAIVVGRGRLLVRTGQDGQEIEVELDDDDQFESIDNYFSREPPPVQDFLQLEKEHQARIAKERQSAVARWLLSM